jgi:hypothetical protein
MTKTNPYIYTKRKQQKRHTAMKKIMTLAVVATLAWSGCSSTDDEEPTTSNYPEDNVIRVATRVTNATQTRGGDEASTSKYTGENFALYVTPTGTTNDFTYNNVWYTQASDGTWNPQDGIQRHWQSASTPYVYYAYAPAKGANGTGLGFYMDDYYDIDDWDYIYDEASVFSFNLAKSNFDLLWTHGEGTPASLLNENQALPLTFDHQFSQFTLEVEIGNDFYGGVFKDDENPVTAVSILNAGGVGIFNVKTGQLKATRSCEIDVTGGTHTAGSLTSDGKFVTDAAYIAPGSQELTIYLTIGNKDYIYTHSTYNYQAGKSYTMKVKVGLSGVNAVGVGLSEWAEAEDSGELSTF